MKRNLILAMACVAYSISALAFSPNDLKSFDKLNNKVTFTSMVGFIEADQEQAVFLERVIKVTGEELKNAAKKNDDAAVENVINYNLRNAKCILSDSQYRKYLVFVNNYARDENSFAMASEK